jgi:histidinol-phosphate phosphatase family protein
VKSIKLGDSVQAVILAGGKGTRLGNTEMPKVMIKIGGTPILEHQIELLRRHGVKDIVLCVKHMSEKIREYFGDGSQFGVRIAYSEEKEFLGTAGAIKLTENLLEKDFMLFYGDVMMNMNIAKLFEYHKNRGGIATLVVHGSDHPHDSDIVDIGPEGRVRMIWRPAPGEKFRNLTNAAVFVLSRSVTEHIPKNSFANLEKDTLPGIIEKGIPVYAYETDEYIKDMGTPERLEKVSRDFRDGKILKREAVFLDRDGVINEEVDLVRSPSQLKLVRGSTEAIRMLKQSGFLVIAVTNQPVVARNMCSEEDLAKIHEKLKEMLAAEGARLDAIYYCPHHPDRGYPEENPKYKIDCGCRKPKTGMIEQATEDFIIDPKESFMVGDTTRDVQTGKNAGCRTILVRTGFGGRDGKFDAKPDYVCENLLEAAKLIIKARGQR